MTIVNHETGEIVDTIGASNARRITTEAQNEFRSGAAHTARGWELVEEAVLGGGHFDLGYRSPSDYLSAEFEGILSGFNIAERRLAVRTMTGWGLSTRGIAAPLGVSDITVRRDQAPATYVAPRTSGSVTGGEASADSGQTPQGEVAPVSTPSDSVPSPTTPRPAVTGIDGKTYSRPEPKATPMANPEYDNAAQACLGLTRAMSRLLTFEHPNMRAGMRAYWSLASAEVPPVQRQDVTPELMRAAARGLLELADEWESQ